MRASRNGRTTVVGGLRGETGARYGRIGLDPGTRLCGGGQEAGVGTSSARADSVTQSQAHAMNLAASRFI